MEYEFSTRGTCARRILFRLEEGKVYDLRFVDGCPGNTLGLAQLAEGMEAEELIRRLRGVRCGRKDTSCPDQLAQALERARAARGE